MKLLDKMRQEKLLSVTMLLFTLSIGILIGTLVSNGVSAAPGQKAAPDATPLTVPKIVEIGNDFTKLAKKLEPSVVNITVEVTAKQTRTTSRSGKGRPQQDDSDDDGFGGLFRQFGIDPRGGGVPQNFKSEQGGTGFIVDKNGYIVTNNHVVEGGSKIKVKLHNDPTDYRARVIGTDLETDLAIIKIDPNHALEPVTFANSDGVQVGDWAVAIGSPFGLEASVTAGIVSAFGRNLPDSKQFQRFIQTDAAINPGNSGGPLLNIRGEVIGVNTQIATSSRGSEGVGFALPSNMVIRVYNDIIKDGHVTRGSIGVGLGGADAVTLKALGLNSGVNVTNIVPGGPADKGGVKAEDIIVAINGKPVKDGDDLVSRVSDTPIGSPITLTVDREGKKVDLKVTVQDRLEVFKDDPRIVGENARPVDPGKPEVGNVKFGVQLRELSQAEKDKTPSKRGMAIASVVDGSFAEDINLLQGDIITQINQQPISSMDDVRKVQGTLKPGDAVAFRVLRTPPTGRNGKGGDPVSILVSGTLPRD